MPPVAPRLNVPELGAQIREPCPPAPLIAGTTLGDLISADAALAKLYEDCRAKHSGAVEAYDLLRGLMIGAEGVLK